MKEEKLYDYYFTQRNIDQRLADFFMLDCCDEEYSRLIYGTGNSPVMLWESALINSKNVLLDATTLQVREFYQACGLDICEELHQLPDYIGLELEFITIISDNIVNSLEHGNNMITEDLIYLRSLFIKNHISRFFGIILDGLEEKSQNKNMKKYVSFARENFCKELEYIKNFNEIDDFVIPNLQIDQTKQKRFCNFEQQNFSEKIVLTAGRGNCGGRCVIKAHVKNDCLLQIESDIDSGDELPVLKACVRGRGYRKTYLSSDRIRYPMKRTGQRGEGKFVRISWEEAIETIASQTKRIGELYGKGSRYVNYASGISAVFRGDMLARRLLAADGGFLGNYNTYSSACAEIAVPYTYGTNMVGSSLNTLLDSKLIILWGYNPVVTLFNPVLFSTLKKIKDKKIKVIVIDPQFSDTAAVFATQWIGIKPTTDSALVAAMAYVILERGLEDRTFMDKFCIGFDEEHMDEITEGRENYTDYIYGKYDKTVKTPAWAEKITGVKEQIIIQLAIEYATSKPAAILPGLGPQRHGNGEQTVRSIMILPCLTGNIGVSGGHTGGNGGLQQHKIPCVSSIENPYKASIPSFLWTDAIERGTEMTAQYDRVRGKEKLDSNIKMIINLAGNTLINQHSDINKTRQILCDTTKCEFIVCSDLFMTPSANYSDILLPGTSLFEGNNLTMPWGEGNFLLYNNKAIEPLFESRFEYDWLEEVSRKMGIHKKFTNGMASMDEWIEKVYQDLKDEEEELPDFEEFKRNGGYKYSNNKVYIAFKDQIENFNDNPFPTPSGKIEIFSERLFQMKKEKLIPAIPKYVSSFEGPEDDLLKKYPIQLIGWHTKRRCHSVHDNNEWMEEIEPHRLWLNTKDAKERGLKEGNMAEILNDRGIIHTRVHVTSRMIAGVAALPQGAWYTPDKNGVDIRGSINTITTLQPTPLAKGNPQHSNLVQIRAVQS